jgi:hypothetical protein
VRTAREEEQFFLDCCLLDSQGCSGIRRVVRGREFDTLHEAAAADVADAGEFCLEPVKSCAQFVTAKQGILDQVLALDDTQGCDTGGGCDGVSAVGAAL